MEYDKMKLTLTIQASAAVMAQIIASLPAEAETTGGTLGGDDVAFAAPVATPQPLAAVPMTQPAPVAQSADDDTTGDVTDNVPTHDADGLPHDGRIHSTPPTVTAKGVWRKKRGVEKHEIAAVEAELRAGAVAPVAGGVAGMPMTMPAGDNGAGFAPMTPPVTVTPVAPVAMPTAAVNPQPVAPVAMPAGDNAALVAPVAAMPVMAPTPAVPVAQPDAGALDFGAFMQHLSGKMQQVDGNGVAIINIDILGQVVATVNQQLGTQFAAITDINGNQPAIDAAVAVLTACGRW